MTKFSTGLALLAAVATVPTVAPHAVHAQSLAFTPVNVIDVREGVTRPDMTVIVTDGRITTVRPADSVEVPADTRVVDGTGKYLIPGLWDMHAHTSSDRITREILLPLFVANGVTGIRNMAADCFETGEPNCGEEPIATIEDVREWRRRIATGTLIGPRIVAGSYYVNSPPVGEPSTPQYPRTAEHGRAHARLLHERGVDFIKIYDRLSREAYFALADEANRLGLPFAGHVPVAVRASEASEAGQRSIEHCCAGNVLEQCSAREDELRDRVLTEIGSEEPEMLPLMLQLVESYDADKCAELFATFVQNGTWFTPTLMIWRLPSEVGPGWREDPRVRFLPREEREFFAEQEEFYDSLVGDEAAREPYSRWVRRVTEAMHRAGVRILAGSDAGYPGIYWGSALHQELELLITAGLTEADALRAATLEPARYLDATDSLGTVEVGKLADLVLLDANPLEDISNTREIAAVVVDGRYLDREALDQMLAEAEQAANPPDATDDSVPHEERSPADEARGDTVHVAPPTGETETDRASILAALDEVEPEGTILFGAGTYLVGPVIRVETPGLTLLGHPDGTVLRGCDRDVFEASEREMAAALTAEDAMAAGAAWRRCGMLELTGGHVTVRDLTFELSRLGLLLGCCHLERRFEASVGGYLIEGNTFRNSHNGVRPWTTESSTIRGNRFVNSFHAISGAGSHLRVLDNEISVPEPGRVPGVGHPSFAVVFSTISGRAAEAIGLDDNGEGVVVSGNRIEGHPDGIFISALPGTSFRNSEIRHNTIRVERVPIPASGVRSYIVDVQDESDSTIVGVPLVLYPRAFPGAPEGGPRPGSFEDNVIAGNRLVGAEGIAFALRRGSRNRIVGNTIVGVKRRDPFPGNTVVSSTKLWREANGSAIWLSPGSDGNEIAGNTFEDVAAAAVVVEGDSNRVELRSPDDAVRDLGTGNQVSAVQQAAVRGEWVAVEGEMYGAPVPEASLPLLRLTFDDTEGRWTLPGHPQTFRYTVHGEAAPDSLDLHLPIEAPRTWLIPVRSGLRGDTLDVAFPLAEPYDSTRAEAPGRPESAAPGRIGPYLRLSLVRRSAAPSESSDLTGEERHAADRVDADAIEEMTRALVAPEMAGRESGEPGGERAARVIAGWFREAGLEPLGDDGFLQRVPLILGRAAPSSTLTVGDTTFHVGGDFAIGSLPMRTRPAMRFDATGEVVLFGPSLGYGRSDTPIPELDVEGKIVAWVASAGPGDGSPADLMRTYEVLHRNGAEAVIALFPGSVPEAWLRSPVFSEIGALDADLYGSGPARPLVLLGQEAFGALFGDGSEVRAFMSEFAPGEHEVQPTGREVTVSYEIEETTAAPTHNVVGVLRGRDPELRDEAVVYSAHYDAFGTYDGEVYPGAADNALGVAEMIEIADALHASGVRPRRSLVFLAVGAEERGMLGSLHWTRHPTWPLDRVVANINMDGGDAEAWGPLHGVIDLTRQATLVDPAAEVAAAMGVPALPDNTSGGWSGSSDFYDFLRAGVPAIQLMGIGGDPALSRMRMQRFGGQRVHQPGDTIDEGWDWDGPREMAQLYLLLGLRVANADERPSMRPASPFSAPDTTRYVEVVEGRTTGSWRTWEEGPRTRGYEDDRFDHFPRIEHLEVDASGLPVRLEATGQISDGVPWYERFERGRDTARWFTPRTRGEASLDGPAFYETVFPAIDIGVLARALLRQPSRELPLLPEGRARLEAMGERVAEAGERRRTVRLFAVHGMDLYPRYVWLDEEGATFADEWSVLEGWEAAFPALRARVDSAVAGDFRELAGTVTPPPRTGPLVIRGARLFDPETGDVRDGTTIVVEGERVAAVGPDGEVFVPEGAEVLEAKGRMAIPGLWDVHAHLRLPASQSQLFMRGAEALHLAGGVTSVRDMGSHVGSLMALREAIEAGEAVGPRVEMAGFIYDTTQTDVIENPVANAAETRALVDRYADMGFPQVKLYVAQSELAQAAIARAKEHGMRVVGHLPFDMTSREAVEAGWNEMTHLWWMVWTIPWTNEASIAAGETFQSWHQVFAALPPDSEPVREFVTLLAERGVAVDPTMGYFLGESTPPEFVTDAVDRLPAPVARYLRHKPWQPNYFPRSPLARDTRDRAVANLLALLPVLHEAGVPILPGTDTWPGFGLHYELELYVEAGIPATEVLTLATLGAAREMGRTDELGTIEPGKLADLILVDGDPTEDIRDIGRVTTVVKGGTVYDPAAIYRALGVEPCCEE